ncbi:MAG: haloacid dehalogenase-like hydrolase [Chloroflexota bacterium]|nr:MAG: haloacid dehalogenase-like hydrolase [Chloroflexota bacterium]
MTNFLPSWNDGKTKERIINFVDSATDSNQTSFVPAEDRIAVFDNDGTLWCEKPMYIQLDFLLRKLAAQAERDASLRSKQPWQSAWEKDYDWLGGAVTKHYQGDDGDLKVLLGGILALSEGQAVEQIESDAGDFIQNEQHPTLGLTYRDCIYQPMLELLRYLQANGFSNYIVSGGGRDFMRGFANDLYGIPRERVIGSTVVYQYVEGADGGTIVQKAELDVIDDGPAKPVQIWNTLGRRPILAAGNSNGDLQMLTFAGGPSMASLRLLVLHDDADREFEYTAGAENVLSTAQEQDWTVISMKDDWNTVFAFD